MILFVNVTEQVFLSVSVVFCLCEFIVDSCCWRCYWIRPNYTTTPRRCLRLTSPAQQQQHNSGAHCSDTVKLSSNVTMV